MPKQIHNQGQVVLMVVLTMLVGLTIATGIFLNSLSDTQLTTTEENSERAFNAAEAGIEDLIKDIGGTVGIGTTTVSVGDETAEVVSEENNTFDFIVKQNSAATLFLDGDAAREINISWTDARDGSTENPDSCDEGDGEAPAGLIIQKWHGDGTVSTTAYNPYGCSGMGTNFNESGSGGAEFNSQISLTTTDGDLFYRIRPVYNQARIKIDGANLPTQQYEITSTTQAGSGETRAIKVTKTRPSLPEIFDYALYSGDTLVK